MTDAPSQSEPKRLGRYWMFDAFARGGVASVHLGRFEASPGIVRVVAIKRLDPKCAEESIVQRLLEEARLLFRVRHPCVVPTLDVIREEGEVALVLEYVHGVSLSALLAESGKQEERLDPPVVVAILADMLRGLHAAHEARATDGAPLGIVHRDVSPQNVVVGSDGIARLVDFGIAKALGREKLTVTGTTLGKVVYMAPEQLKGLALTAQADLYSAGVVAWECLTGRSFADALEKRKDGVPSPRALNADIPEALDRVIVKAIAREARNRYASGEEMAAALEDACPRAPATDVARLVERLACDDLERRADAIKRVESYETRSVVEAIREPRGEEPKESVAPVAVAAVTPELAAPLDEQPPSSGRAEVIWTSPHLLSPEAFEATVLVERKPERRKRPGLVALPAMIAIVVAVVIGVGTFMRAGTAAEAPTRAASPSTMIDEAPKAFAPPPVVPSEPAAPRAPSIETLLAASHPPTVAPAPREPAVIVLDEPPRSKAVTERPRPRPAPKPAPVARTEPQDCDPPFRIDERGNKRYKPECLR